MLLLCYHCWNIERRSPDPFPFWGWAGAIGGAVHTSTTGLGWGTWSRVTACRLCLRVPLSEPGALRSWIQGLEWARGSSCEYHKSWALSHYCSVKLLNNEISCFVGTDLKMLEGKATFFCVCSVVWERELSCWWLNLKRNWKKGWNCQKDWKIYYRNRDFIWFESINFLPVESKNLTIKPPFPPPFHFPPVSRAILYWSDLFEVKGNSNITYLP